MSSIRIFDCPKVQTGADFAGRYPLWRVAFAGTWRKAALTKGERNSQPGPNHASF